MSDKVRGGRRGCGVLSWSIPSRRAPCVCNSFCNSVDGNQFEKIPSWRRLGAQDDCAGGRGNGGNVLRCGTFCVLAVFRVVGWCLFYDYNFTFYLFLGMTAWVSVHIALERGAKQHRGLPGK